MEEKVNNAMIIDLYKVWKAIFNETYIQQRDKAKWTNTLIYLGVYAGLMFFLGLMVFILTDTIDVAGATTLCAIFICPAMLMYLDYLTRAD